MKRFLVLAGVMLACASATLAEPYSARVLADTPPSGVAAILVELTNAERTRAGKAPFRANPRLMKAAQLQADQMARLGRVGHVLPEAAYPRPEDRLAAVAYTWRAFAENLSFGQRDPAEAVGGWMQSSEHRANMMNSSYVEIGVGHGQDKEGRHYYVQVFGRPSS